VQGHLPTSRCPGRRGSDPRWAPTYTPARRAIEDIALLKMQPAVAEVWRVM
jgi:hypothetical protein